MKRFPELGWGVNIYTPNGEMVTCGEGQHTTQLDLPVKRCMSIMWDK
jgi:hypothetical protein